MEYNEEKYLLIFFYPQFNFPLYLNRLYINHLRYITCLKQNIFSEVTAALMLSLISL